jgi:site-specific DNA-methyltransferase (adenine-specific)
MAHLSENSRRLIKNEINVTPNMIESEPSIWFVNLPYFENLKDSKKYVGNIKSLSDKLHENSVLALYTSPLFASEFCSDLPNDLHFKLWIAVKLSPKEIKADELTNHHSALIILTKYGGALNHTKTRIGYSYCPACDKTTKDYGGKKHLYNQYGTLMSDVWRDISEVKGDFPDGVIDRLQDLFGLEQLSKLNYIDFNKTTLKNNQKIYSNSVSLSENKFSFEDNDESVLINEDCLTALAKIPSNSIDFCFADPPYNIKKKYENWNDGLDIQEYFDWCDKWLSELARVLKPGRTLAVLNIPQWCIRHFQHLKTELDYQDWIVWEGLSLPVRMIMPAHYGIICFSKGKPRPLPALNREFHSIEENISFTTKKEWFCKRKSCLNKRRKLRTYDSEMATNMWWDIHRLKHNSRRVDHPCQLPPTFMQRLISLFTNETEIVLDPFNGVGTTTLTAEMLNRKFVGIELSEYYHNICQNRHEELKKGLDPFRKNDKTPKTKNSYVKRVQKQSYEVPKKKLQLDVRRISEIIGRMPTREDVQEKSKYPIEYFDNYFMNWAEVCAAARTTGMTENRISYQVETEKDIQLRLFKEQQAKYQKEKERLAEP